VSPSWLHIRPQLLQAARQGLHQRVAGPERIELRHLRPGLAVQVQLVDVWFGFGWVSACRSPLVIYTDGLDPQCSRPLLGETAIDDYEVFSNQVGYLVPCDDAAEAAEIS